MTGDELKTWSEIVSLTLGVTTGLLGALWGYSKFIVERGLLPPTRFWVTCERTGVQDNKHLAQVVLHIKNLGSSTLIAADIRVDILYLRKEDKLELFADAQRAGRLRFWHSLRKDSQAGTNYSAGDSGTSARRNAPTDDPPRPKRRGFPIVAHDTFIQAGVHQTYTFVTAFPDDATFVLVHGSFRYAQRPSALASAALVISRRLGLVQFTLAHVREPHTTENVFSLS